MAHSLSAQKRVRQNEKRRAQNRTRKEGLKEAVKGFLKVAATDIGKAADALKGVVSKLDKIASKGTIHKNTAARRRSRLTKRLNAMKTAAANPAPAAKAKAKPTKARAAKSKTSKA